MGIAEVYNEGRLIRGRWSDTDAAGRELLCLYTALVGTSDSRPPECPVDVAPRWLAYLLPFIDDRGSAATWDATVCRVAELAPRFGKLSPRCEWRVRLRMAEIAIEKLRAEGAGDCWIELAELAKAALLPGQAPDMAVRYREFRQGLRLQILPEEVEACEQLAFAPVNRGIVATAAFNIARDSTWFADRIIAATLEEIEADLRTDAAH